MMATATSGVLGSGEFGTFRFGIGYLEDNFTDNVLASEAASYELGCTITENFDGGETYVDNQPSYVTESITFTETISAELSFSESESFGYSEYISGELRYGLTESLNSVETISSELGYTANESIVGDESTGEPDYVNEIINFVESVSFTIGSSITESVVGVESIGSLITSAYTELLQFVEGVVFAAVYKNVCVQLSCSLPTHKPVILYCKLKC